MASRFEDRARSAVHRSRRGWENAVLGLTRRTYGEQRVGLFEYSVRPAARYGWDAPPIESVLEVLQRREGESDAMVRTVLTATEAMHSIPGGRSDTDELTWDNDWWADVDALVLYTALRDRNPARYVEVGSGWSTKFARRAITDHGLRTSITSIDPQPRAEIDAICDQVVRTSLEEADLELFAGLEAGDVVVMDGSHTSFMNSDTVAFFFDVMPRLAPGVLVAIDDIFLPWDYPPSWSDRWYGEQYILAAMLAADDDRWNLTFPGWYLVHDSAGKDRFDPLWAYMRPKQGNHSTSFWLERR